MASRPMNPDPSRAYLALALLLLLLPAATATPYSSLCGSPAAVADRTGEHSTGASGPLGLPPLSTGYFSGGAELLFASDPYLPRSFYFFPRRVVLTDDPAVLHLFATVTLAGLRRSGTLPHSVSFDLEGYYSTASSPAVLCMVGSGSRARDDGLGVVVLPDVALRLSLPIPANLSHPFAAGRLEGADFTAVDVVAYADGGYSYSHAASCSPPPTAVRGARQVLDADFSCARLRALLQSSGSYRLEYIAGHASPPGSPPLRRHRRMYVNQVHCDGDGDMRALMVLYGDQWEPLTFYNHTLPWRPGFCGDEALVADGFWDSSRSRLCLRACQVVRPRPSSADWTVAKCGIGMNIWFPAAWSIQDRSVVAGSIWNTSTKSDDDTKISVSRTANFMENITDIKYQYSLVEEAKKHYNSNCKAELSKKNTSRIPVPGNFSYHDFKFSFYLRGQSGHGYASPVTIGSALVAGDQLMADAAFYGRAVAEMNRGTLLNVSYDMQYYEYTQIVRPDVQSWNASRLKSELWRISAEGVYDRETGQLCMVACVVNSTWLSDCEVLVTVQFGTIEEGIGESAVVGSISSLRGRSDALFFDEWSIVGYRWSMAQAAESISRMDAENVAAVLAMALSCVFTALQLRHARKNPDALPAMSVTMLAVIALGYAVPYVFASRRNSFVELSAGWLFQLNELALRASAMVVLVLQLRLLQLAWSSRSAAAAGDGEHDGWSAAERSALWICLPLYLAGGVLFWIAHIGDGQVQARGLDDIELDAPRPLLPEHLVAYAGLVLDGFLLPQIALNAFSGSRVRALSPWFYAGGTVIRAAPHAYDALMARGWAAPFVYYTSPRNGHFSVAWDVVVTCAAVSLVVLLFLQQRFGGAFLCCLGRRRRAGGYEMVSSTTPGQAQANARPSPTNQ